MWTRASSFVPSPIQVSESDPRAIEQLAYISTPFPSLTWPLWGNFSNSPPSYRSKANPSDPKEAPDWITQLLPTRQFCTSDTLSYMIVLSPSEQLSPITA